MVKAKTCLLTHTKGSWTQVWVEQTWNSLKQLAGSPKQLLWLPLMENMTCQACTAGSGVAASSYPALNSAFMTTPVTAWGHRRLESLWIPCSHPSLEAALLFLHIVPSRSSSSLPQALFEHSKPLRRPAIKLSRCLMAHNKYCIFGKEAHKWVCHSWLTKPSQTHKCT